MFRSFLKKNYNLADFIPQSNNFVIFNKYFSEIQKGNINRAHSYAKLREDGTNVHSNAKNSSRPTGTSQTQRLLCTTDVPVNNGRPSSMLTTQSFSNKNHVPKYTPNFNNLNNNNINNNININNNMNNYQQNNSNQSFQSFQKYVQQKNMLNKENGTTTNSNSIIVDNTKSEMKNKRIS